MMAKMFYRFDEARQVLAMSDEQLRQLTREGKLREFRDGTQVMYKADQVDQLKREMGLGGESVDLGPSDTGGPVGLVDSRSDTSGGSVISLSDTSSNDDTASDMGLSGSGSSIGLASSATGTGIGLAGTGSGMNIGSASGTGTTSPGAIALSSSQSGIGLASSHASLPGGSIGGGSVSGGSVAGGSLGGTRAGSGVSVLGLDEGGGADANAATAMGGSFGGEPGMEAMGSGSGLLDLSREHDDTSLGAPVLNEFNTGSGSRSGSAGAISGAPLTATAPAAATRTTGVPVYVEEASNFAGFAAGASAGAALFALVALYCVAAAAMRAEPSLLSAVGLGGTGKAMPMLYVLGAGIVAALLLGVVGFFVGKRR
jgi:hypothetical protein